MKTVLLPVKDFRNAKQRLASALSPNERADLAKAMLSDVLRAISVAQAPERVIIFTASESVTDVVRPFGFEIVREISVQGHSAAVNFMTETLSGSATHLLSIAGDLPRLTGSEIDEMFGANGVPINLVSSHDGTGTNAVMFALPARIAMDYGEGSLARHLSTAAAAGLPARVLPIPGMQFDVDTPEDVRLFLQLGSHSSETWRYLSCR